VESGQVHTNQDKGHQSGQYTRRCDRTTGANDRPDRKAQSQHTRQGGAPVPHREKFIQAQKGQLQRHSQECSPPHHAVWTGEFGDCEKSAAESKA
jgi:hypothetical protein